MSVGDALARLAGFPDGWPRRRAIDALVERGVEGGLDALLALVETLGSPADRRWCARRAARTHGLDREAERAWLARVGARNERPVHEP